MNDRLVLLFVMTLSTLVQVAPAPDSALAADSGTVAGKDAKPVWQVKVVTKPATAIYKVDEYAVFLATVTRNGRPVTDGKVEYVVDDFITDHAPPNNYPRGALPLGRAPTAMVATLDRPGFLRCRVSYRTPEGKRITATAGAGFSPRQIQPSLPAPDDFEAFWAGKKRQLAEVPLQPVRTPVKSKWSGIDCFDVQVPCLGAPVSGYFAKPAGAKAGTLPAILWVHGAGVRSSSLQNAVSGARLGMLSMDINAHGIPNGRPAAFYTALNAGRLKDYRYAGRESRDTSYFVGMYVRLVRAIDFLTAQPEWDHRVVVVMGHSQGGGQALVAGGIDPRVTFVAAGVPAMCDHSARVVGRVRGWPKLVPIGADGKSDAKVLAAARYVDAVNFAARCQAEAVMSVGFIDRVCPPSSCYAAWNQLRGKKAVINKPLMGHAAPKPVQDEFIRRIKQHVKRMGRLARKDGECPAGTAALLVNCHTPGQPAAVSGR